MSEFFSSIPCENAEIRLSRGDGTARNAARLRVLRLQGEAAPRVRVPRNTPRALRADIAARQPSLLLRAPPASAACPRLPGRRDQGSNATRWFVHSMKARGWRGSNGQRTRGSKLPVRKPPRWPRARPPRRLATEVAPLVAVRAALGQAGNEGPGSALLCAVRYGRGGMRGGGAPYCESAAQNCAAGAENSKPPKTCRWKVFWGRMSDVNFVTIVAWLVKMKGGS